MFILEFILKGKKMKKIVFYFLFSVSCIYLLWALILPFNQGPDEYHRFDVANFIYQYKELPVAGDERLFYGVYGVTYATNLSFPYLLGSILMIVSDFFGDIENLYLVHRMVSVLSGILAVYFVYKIAQLLKLETKFLYFFVAIFALIPQYAFINSYVNLDSFTVFILVLIMYLLLKGEKEQWALKNLIFLGIATGLALLSYLNGYVIVPAAIVYLFLSIKNKKVFLKNILIIASVALIVAGPFFLRNAILYQDLLGMDTNAKLSEELAIEELKPSNRQTPYAQGMTLSEMLLDKGWLVNSFNSFFASFGYFSIWLSLKHYYMIATFVLTSLIGVLLGGYFAIKRNIKGGITELLNKYRFIIMQLLVIGLTIFLSIYYSYFSDFQPQGRYLYPAYFSIIYLVVLGIRNIVNKEYRNIVFLLIVIYVAYLNLYSLYKLIFMNFYS